jgi:two-component system response regulator DesR
VSSLAGALDRADARVVDVLLVHAEFWLGAETSSLARYRSRTTALPVIIVSQTEPLFGFDALLRTGVSCVCPLSIDDELLCEILKHRAAAPNNLASLLSNPAITPEIIRRQSESGRWPTMPDFRLEAFPRELNETEVRILRMAGRGLSTGLIGEVLGISERAVDHRIAMIQLKLDLGEEVDLRRLAVMGSKGRFDQARFKVVIVDPNESRRETIMRRAAENTDIEILASVDTISSVTPNRFDVLVLGTPVDVLIDRNYVSGLRMSFDFVPVVAIADQVTNDLLVTMQQALVAEIVDRDTDGKALGRSIRRVARGEYPIMERLGRDPWGQTVSPTEAECTILRGFRDGVPDAEIRRTLNVGRWTYLQMRQTMKYRLALKNRADAVRIAIKFGWIEPVASPDEASSVDRE